jgi:hypothetical protein
MFPANAEITAVDGLLFGWTNGRELAVHTKAAQQAKPPESEIQKQP